MILKNVKLCAFVSFHVLALWTTCANRHKNWLSCSPDERMDRQTIMCPLSTYQSGLAVAQQEAQLLQKDHAMRLIPFLRYSAWPGHLRRRWRVLFTRGLSMHAQDVLEPLAEWFYATEYISSASLAFRDLRRRIVVVFSN